MRDKVMISVIMPVYNGQDWLHDSIGSILSQDFSNYEIIIVNDGSTDNSAEILNEYAANHPNIRVFNNTNSGPGNSLNFGIQQAQGKYLCFIDQDDMYDSKYLSSMYAAIEKSDADLCMCYGRTFENETGHTERLRFPYIETGIISDKYGLLDCFYPQWTKIIKRDFILQHDIKFPLRHNPVHDVPFHILTVYFAKKIFILNAELYRHRVHPGQITHNLISFAKKGNIISLQDIESYYKTHPSAGRELMQFALGLMNFRGNFWQKLTIKRFRLKYNLKSEIIRIFYKKSYDDKFCRTRILCFKFKKKRKTSGIKFSAPCLPNCGKHTYCTNALRVANPQQTAIGSFVSIGINVQLGHGEHPTHFLSTSPYFYFDALGFKSDTTNSYNNYWGAEPIIIGNDVWIGDGVFVKNGIHIGNGAIIGAHSVVTHDVPPYAIVAGVPAKIIRYRFSDDICGKLENLRWWRLPDDIIKQIPFDDIDKAIKFLSIYKKDYDI